VKPDKQDAFFRIISAVLHASLVEYDDSKYDGSGPCGFATKQPLEYIAHCLELDFGDLERALTTKTSIVMNEEVVMFLDKNACVNQAEAFAKDIYSKLFDWIVKYLNLALLPAKEK
jgi:myosin heavy subunit